MQTNFSKRRIAIFIAGLMAVWFFANGSAHAAKLFPETKSFSESGKQFYNISIILDTEKEVVDVLKGEMHYPAADLKFEKILSGGSIINLWLEDPKQSAEGKITFSGGIPNGYKGEKGFIFSAVFSAKENSPIGRTEISFRNCEAYLDDGKGTKRKIADSGNTVDFSLAEKSDAPVDIKPPEVFAPYVTSDSDLEGGKWVAIFNAQDKGGGIDHYEVFESAKRYDKEKMAGDGSIGWNQAQNLASYVLRDQNLKSYIYVKAVDKTGNARVAEVVPAPRQNSNFFGDKTSYVMIILLFFSASAAIYFKLRGNKTMFKNRRNRN
jgi:hypothetical protein